MDIVTRQPTGSDDSHASQPKKARRRDSTTGQTAKKRELDRIAQKKSRERARNRMKELEDKLNRLQDDDKQKQITDLLRTVDELRRENERLRGVTQRIRCLTDVAGPRLKPAKTISKSGTPAVVFQARNEEDEEEISDKQDQSAALEWWDRRVSAETPRTESQLTSMDLETACSPENIYETSLEIYSPTIQNLSPNSAFLPFTHLADFDTALSWGTPGQIRLTKSGAVVPDLDKWRTSNEAFIFGIDIGKNTAESHVLNSHAAYKAILWGCDEREEREREHPLWLALRQVDEKVFGMWQSKAQKIAMMFVCHRMLMYRANPCPETLNRVPTFLRPRPSQETIQHPAVIDFLIWPGLRDRLVFSHPRYTATGSFSKAFCENLHFYFPYPDSSILSYDPVSQTHRLSSLFEEYALDVRNWTMDEGFFVGLEEMRGDVPCSKARGWVDGDMDKDVDWKALFDGMPMVA